MKVFSLSHWRRRPILPSVFIATIISIAYGAFIFLKGHSSIKVHCKGKGKTVYVISGGPAFTSRTMANLQTLLTQHFKVCRWDMRGVGDNFKSTLNKNKNIIKQWLNDMDKILPRNVILIGRSWGSIQVLLYARHNPGRVSKIVLINPVDPKLKSLEILRSNLYSHSGLDKFQPGLDAQPSQERSYFIKRRFASYFINAKTGWSEANKLLSSQYPFSNPSLNVRVWQEYRLNKLTSSDLDKLEDKIRAVIFCEKDVLMPKNIQQYRLFLKPDRLFSMKGCAHFPSIENPKVLIPNLIRYLSS